MLRFIGFCFVVWVLWASKLLSLGLIFLGNLLISLGLFFG